MAEDATADTTSETATPTGGRTAGELRGIADGLRERVDLFGKALAAIATLGTTAVGLTKVGDLFPVSGWGWFWVFVACTGLAAAALAAIWVAVRLMTVAGPAFISFDASGGDDLTSEERTEEAEPIFKAAAARFGYDSLAGVQARELSLRSAAAQAGDETERLRRLALADEAKTEIELALARSQVAVVRRRAKDVVSDKLAWRLYVAVIAGLIFFAVGADIVASDRISAADAKTCGEARDADATVDELKRTQICEGVAKAETPDAAAKPLSAVEARAEIATQLAAVLKACAAFVRKPGETTRPFTKSDCEPIRQAVTSWPR